MTKIDSDQTLQAAKAPPDPLRLITDDYECRKDCRNCPFPGAKCFPDKYDKYDTKLLYKE